VHRYPDAGHGFNCDDRDAFHPPSAELAWSRTLAWFGRHLAGEGSELT
jgi:carboxymethylenebutenolidase